MPRSTAGSPKPTASPPKVSPSRPVHLAFPLDALQLLLPVLYPEAASRPYLGDFPESQYRTTGVATCFAGRKPGLLP